MCTPVSESDVWSAEEIEAYHQALLKCDKDFFNIAREVSVHTYLSYSLIRVKHIMWVISSAGSDIGKPTIIN